MGVIGQERQELAHSAAIAWLLDPRMPHGLGSRLLSALASSCYPDEAFAELGQAWTDREVARANARIDILVHGPNVTLVLENKVDALESEGSYLRTRITPPESFRRVGRGGSTEEPLATARTTDTLALAQLMGWTPAGT